MFIRGLFLLPSPESPISWASRLKPALIRRLYQSDATGPLDEVLIDEVGIGLLARCESVHRVTKRLCPGCGDPLDGAWDRGRNRSLRCSGCDWQSTWAQYHGSYRGKSLHGGRAYDSFIRFLRDYPVSRTPQQKMAAIDVLIHSLHEWARETLTRPAAHNLIQGSRDGVFDLLENLAYGDQRDTSSEGARASYFRRLARSPEATTREGFAFEKLHQDLAGRMSAFFSRHLDDSLKTGIAYVDRCTFYEFVESLDDPVCTYTFTITPPAGPAVLAYDPSVVKMLVKHGLGGKVEGPLNAAKRIVMDGVVAKNLVHLADTRAQTGRDALLSS